MGVKMPCASFLFCSSNYTLSLDELEALEAVEVKVTIELRWQFGKTKMDATSLFLGRFLLKNGCKGNYFWGWEHLRASLYDEESDHSNIYSFWLSTS